MQWPCEQPVDAYLDAYDDFREYQYDVLVESYADMSVTPLPYESFIDPTKWRWGNGTRRRACLIEMGEGKRYRDHSFFPCMEDFLRDEEGPAHREMLNAAREYLNTYEPSDTYYSTCDSPDGDPAKALPYRDCHIPEDD